MDLKPILIREQVIKSIREFFDKKGFHEVVATVLNKSLPVEPNIYPFITVWTKVKAQNNLYLSTSPEASLKKMIAKGIGNCFAIGKTFRNLEGQGSRHNPEFLMLEWYRENADYKDIMRECERLILYITNKLKSKIQNLPPQRDPRCSNPDGIRNSIGTNIKSNPKSKIRNQNLKNQIIYQHQIIDLSTPWKRYSLIDLFQKYAGLDLLRIMDDKQLKICAKSKGYDIKNKNWEELYNQIFLNEIETQLPPDPFFLTDFPSRISPLCKPKENNPLIAERFELYIGGMELGNGNTENTNSKSVTKVFEEERKGRIREGQDGIPIDRDFIKALDYMKNKSYAGIGLGVDRLAMLLADVRSIKEVEPLC